MNIRDRIVELRRVPARDLIPSERNWRTHPPAQRAALSGVLAEIGIANAVLARQTDDGLVLIDGHLRQDVLGGQDVPVLVLDVDAHEADLLLATLDPIAAMAAADAAQLDALLRDVSTGEAAIQEMLADVAERSGVIPPATFNAADEWVGMPEFNRDDLTSAYQVVVHFAQAEDLDEFSRLVGQHIAPREKNAGSIWFPKRELLTNGGRGYVGDEA